MNMNLETRIETAIAENTDPCTTDADIRFFETEEWNTEAAYSEVKLGTKIIGDFGGYTELWNGEVVAIDTTYGESEVKVVWENGPTVGAARSYRAGLPLSVSRPNGDHTWIKTSEINAGAGNINTIGYYTEGIYYD